MKVFIANFGRENYGWPECLARSTITTLNDVAVQDFWKTGNREAYIQRCTEFKTARGIAPNRSLASRWFNLMSIVAQTNGDVWIHREKDWLWWTKSRGSQPSFEPRIEPVGERSHVIICHKPCDPWSNENRKGNRLAWNGIHPRAQQFLFTESTLHQLGDENSDYALALINGEDLTPWHSKSDWISKAEKTRGKRSTATIFNAKQRAIVRMAMTAIETVKGANGQQILRTQKNKELRFPSQPEFEKYIAGLVDLQEGICAITGLTLQFDGEHDDDEMLCSLDRIDSNGHYEAKNLQVVCRFVNRWKGSSKDDDFRRLIGVVRSTVSI